MPSLSLRSSLAILFLAVVLPRSSSRRKPPLHLQPFKPPADVKFRTASIMSEGTRMAAEVYSLKSLEGKRLPTIVLCHGWGGTAKDLRPEGIAFARAGYLAVAIDYRGWGESDARLVLTGPSPSEKPRTTLHGRGAGSARSGRPDRPDDRSAERDSLGRRRSAVRLRPHRALGFELLGRARRLRRGTRPAGQGHRQPGARTRFAVGGREPR